jgi:tRNA (guanosine-2'-O-)-methyltransferase
LVDKLFDYLISSFWYTIAVSIEGPITQIDEIMDITTIKELIAYLSAHVTPHKLQKMNEIIQHRTKHVTVLLEDLFQQHNASAIVRSVECFGVQDLHVVQQRFKFSINTGVAMGSSKWISIHDYPNVQDAYIRLKDSGYRIVATTPHTNACYLEELPLDKKLVLVFGTENVGLSPWALEHADEFVKIPMVGFTESFNVSVSAALCLYQITSKLRQSSIAWQLNEQERIEVYLNWLRRSIRGSGEYERLFWEGRKP